VPVVSDLKCVMNQLANHHDGCQFASQASVFIFGQGLPFFVKLRSSKEKLSLQC